MSRLSESIWVEQYESNLTIGKESYFKYDKDTVISLNNDELEKLFTFMCANKSDWLAKHDEQVRTGERKKVLIELAWMASANGNAVLEVQLRNMAEQTEGAQTK